MTFCPDCGATDNVHALPDPRVLPDEPDVWSSAEWMDYRQRWLPGAFGEHESIHGLFSFVVQEDRWEEGADGVPERTIVKAKPISGPWHGVAAPA